MKKQKVVTWEKLNLEEPEGIGRGVFVSIWNAVATLLLIFGFVSMLTVFAGEKLLGFSEIFVIVAVCGIAFGVFEPFIKSFLQKSGEKRRKAGKWLLTAGGAMASGLLAGAFYLAKAEEIRSGFAALVSRYSEVYYLAFHRTISAPGADVEFLPLALCFFMVTSFLICFFSSLFLKRKWPFLIYPLAGVLMLMYVGLSPAWGQVSVCLIGIFMIFSGHGSKRQWLSLLCTVFLALLLFMTGLFFRSSAEKLLEHVPQAKAYEAQLEVKIKNLFADNHFVSKGGVHNRRPHYKDAVVMTVTVDKMPEGNLYFKEFGASSYDQGTWRPASKSFEKACEENGISAEQALEWLMGSLYEGSADSKASFQLQYHGNTNAMLIPYGANVSDLTGFKGKEDYYVKKGLFQGKSQFSGIGNNAFQSGDLWAMWNDAGTAVGERRDFFDWYEEYVKETCLETPDFIYGTEIYWDVMQSADYMSWGTSERQKTQEWQTIVPFLISRHLREYFYSWNLDDLTNGEDPVEYFLKRSYKGYCVHFASAGVLLLRAFDIPARYASGYVVTPYMFEETENGSYEAKVIDRNEHAWVEIYIDEAGWVPLEVTPGYDAGSTDYPTSKESQEKQDEQRASTPGGAPATTPVPETPSSEPEEETQPEDGKPEGGNGKSARHSLFDFGRQGDSMEEGGEESTSFGGLLWILTGLAIAAVAVIIIFGVNRAKAGKLERTLKRRYYKAAVLIINRQVYKIMRRRGKLKGSHPTDRDLETALTACFGKEREDQIREYARIVKAAMFSQERISGEECETVRQIYAWIRKK